VIAAVLPNPKGWDRKNPGMTLRFGQQLILARERNARFRKKLLR
jgi:hypothetical protein